jgi:hypothetical protein
MYQSTEGQARHFGTRVRFHTTGARNCEQEGLEQAFLGLEQSFLDSQLTVGSCVYASLQR